MIQMDFIIARHFNFFHSSNELQKNDSHSALLFLFHENKLWNYRYILMLYTLDLYYNLICRICNEFNGKDLHQICGGHILKFCFEYTFVFWKTIDSYLNGCFCLYVMEFANQVAFVCTLTSAKCFLFIQVLSCYIPAYSFWVSK